MTDAPLADLRVVELGDDLGTAFCGHVLAALGADVLRLEPASGAPSTTAWPRSASGASLLHRYLNAGKRIEPDDDAEDAIAAADVVLFSSVAVPPSIDLAVARGAIAVQITRWGETGPLAGSPGSDLVEQAAAGVVVLVGRSDREPLALGGHQAAYAAGIQAFTGTMAALAVRDRRGVGQFVRTSHLEAMACLEWKGPVYYQADGQLLRRGAAGGPLVVPAADGFVAFYYRPTDWPQIVELLGDDRLRDERFATQPGRMAHEDELYGVLRELLASRPKAEVYAAAQARSIPVGTVETMSDLLESEQLRSRGLFEPIDLPDGGTALAPGLPFTFDGARFTAAPAPSDLQEVSNA